MRWRVYRREGAGEVVDLILVDRGEDEGGVEEVWMGCVLVG